MLCFKNRRVSYAGYKISKTRFRRNILYNIATTATIGTKGISKKMKINSSTYRFSK